MRLWLICAQAERKEPTQTHTSTAPLSISAILPEEFVPSSASFRSPGDPSYERARRFLLIDTPGHGKLRHFATSYLTDAAKSASIRGIIFVVDAAAVAEEAGLNEAAEYLHDVLLALQKRHTGSKTSKGPKPIPVLVAANKSDLFTALPSNLVKINLERAITEVRKSRARGVKDVGNKLVADGEDEGVEEEREWLGEGGEGPFEFGAMEEFGTEVVVKGGNVLGGEENDVASWWGWVGEQL